ncbi:MAG: hypothetical protein QM500_11215 [Methylococcales bacterium]
MSNQIKFKHASDGVISIENGTTQLSDLFTIGAVAIASKRNEKMGKIEYATDTEGLEIVSEKAEFAAVFLNNSIRSIGVLLANANDIEHEISSIGWLITGLSELAEMANDARIDIERSLKETGKQGVSNE